MGKYIIDVPKNWVDITKGLHIPIEKGWNVGDLRIDTGLKLTPYTEPNRQAIEDEVWEFVRRIIGMTEDKYCECFDIDDIADDDFASKYSYQEAKKVYEEWEKEKKKICVGDEVKVIEVGSPCIVCGIVDGTANLIYGKGDLGQFPVDRLIKTGRHFNGVEELLRKLEET